MNIYESIKNNLDEVKEPARLQMVFKSMVTNEKNELNNYENYFNQKIAGLVSPGLLEKITPVLSEMAEEKKQNIEKLNNLYKEITGHDIDDLF